MAAAPQTTDPSTEPGSATSSAQAIVERIRAKKKASLEVSQQGQLDLVSLPNWGSDARGLPNSLVRGGLFTAGREDRISESPEPRKWIRGETIPTLSNYQLVYRGEELRQDDASVFIQLVHLAREQPLGHRVFFTGFAFLKELRWAVNKRSYVRLKNAIDRLKATSVQLTSKDGGQGYSKSLVRAFYWQDDTGQALSKWCIELEPEMVRLFGENSYSLVEWQERLRIGSRATLSLWLHSFLATHTEPIPLPLEKYRELSRSDCKQLYHFKTQFRRALDKLVEIGFLKEANISPAGMVTVVRAPRRLTTGMAPRGIAPAG